MRGTHPLHRSPHPFLFPVFLSTAASSIPHSPSFLVGSLTLTTTSTTLALSTRIRPCSVRGKKAGIPSLSRKPTTRGRNSWIAKKCIWLGRGRWISWSITPQTLGKSLHCLDPWKLATPPPPLDWSGARAASARLVARRRRPTHLPAPAPPTASALAGTSYHICQRLLLSSQTMLPPLAKDAAASCRICRSFRRHHRHFLGTAFLPPSAGAASLSSPVPAPPPFSKPDSAALVTSGRSPRLPQ